MSEFVRENEEGESESRKMPKKIILDLCGGTGSWSKPYKDKGYKVIVADLKNDIDITKEMTKNILVKKKPYGILAAPPCPMFSFCRTNAKNPRDLDGAIEIVASCLDIIWRCQSNINSDVQKYSPLKFWALENPNGMLKWFLGKPAFEFSPYEFGDMYKKKTHLWGWFNEAVKTNNKKPDVCKFDKMATKDIHPEFYGKLTRQERRAITPQGFAKAFFLANK